ncbi:hypothetical protein AaE_014120, partial [Aphanomyces astaci]
MFEVLSTIDVITITPTGLTHLGDPHQYPRLKLIATAGEHLPSSLKDLWADHVCLLNCYGPSECAIATHIVRMTKASDVTIGKPISNASCHILDAAMRHVPLGVVGEIYLGGVGVSPGYINLPELTRDRFLKDPFTNDSGMMYRTGDLGRLLPNGQFEILGRMDSQVKLKGYRIELDEVANAMMHHPEIVSAAVVVKDKSHLVGYFTPATVNVEGLRQTVADLLPVYMVPAMWVGLDMLPHNCNGKVDKLALAALEVVHVVDTVQTDLEAQMAAIWAKVLGVNVVDIGRQSSFFSLGGDSLSVVKVIAASKHAGLHLTASDLLNAMVLWRVAEVATSRSSQTWPSAMLTPEVMTSLVEGDSLAKWSHCAVYPVTGLQAGMLLATMRNRDSYVLQSAVELGESMDLDTLQRAFHTLVERHELLRTSFVTTSAGLFQVLRPDTSDIEITNVAAPTLEAFLKQDLAKGFDLTGQLVRWTGVVTECGTYGVMTIHHVLYDGWTVPMLWDDLLDIVRGNQLADRPGFHRVVDFVQAQDEAATQEFWTSYLRGVVASPLSSLTSSGYWNEAFQNSDSSLSLTSKASLKEVHEAARRLDVTTAELVKFAWAATVRKYTRQDDVVFGQVMANRDIPVDGVDRILGPLVSTVPCRVQFNDCLSLASMLDSIRVERGAMTRFAHASLADIKKWSQVEGVKLMDSLFAFQNTPTATDHNGCWSMLKPSNPSTVSEEYTFELIVEPTPTSLNVHALYNPGDISWDQAQWILHEFDHSLWHLCTEATADTGVSELNTLSEAQTALIRSASFGPTVPLPFELLHHAFEARAAKHPDVRAVELDGQWLTYGDLNAHADTVASQLAELGVCVGSRVAVVMDRCLEFPIGLLATLKVGAAMMPLDVAFP